MKSRHRSDIQGLRALLMCQVLLFHAWFIGSPIGVDAFIMISAFLMTSSFVRRAEAGQIPRILERWANTFKRLLPPMAVVVATTLFASTLILPPTRWQTMIAQSYASLTYWQNWLLGSIATDYYAQDHALASPLQHLWSMSMQGQMFLLWPVLMTACVFVARRFSLPIRSTVFWAFATLTAVSLFWLIAMAPDSDSVYFDTRARIWEFALGSAIAAAAPRLVLPRAVGRMVAFIAFTILLIYCLIPIGTYPGPMAAVPLLATSALLLYSVSGEAVGVGGLLAWRPLVALGDISYTVYLVHWPLFVFYLVSTGKERLGIVDGLTLMAVSIVLAYILTRYVDDPVRTSKRINASTSRMATVALLTLWLGVTFVFTVQLGVDQTAQAATRRAAEVTEVAAAAEVGDVAEVTTTRSEPLLNELAKTRSAPASDPSPPPVVLQGFPGAAAMIHEGDFAFDSQPIPGPLVLDAEWVTYPGACGPRANELFHMYPRTGCTSVGDPQTSNGKVLVAGSSHAEQVLMPTTRLFAEENDLYVEAVLQAGCPWTMPNPATGDNCAGNNANLLAYAKEQNFDYIFLIVTATAADEPSEALGHGMETLLQELASTGANVLGIRDNLRSNYNLYECASSQESNERYGGCLLDRNQFFGPDSVVDPLLDLDGFTYVDVMDLYCDADACPTIAGNVHVYLDSNHITGSYGETMAPIILERVRSVMDEEPVEPST